MAKLNGNLKAIIPMLVGLIAILVTIFIFVLKGNDASAQRDDQKQSIEIKQNREDITILKVSVGSFQSSQKDMSKDIDEIKIDVKTLLAR